MEKRKINYAGRVFDQEEKEYLLQAVDDMWLTYGRFSKQFEKGLAEFIGTKYCHFVNSGSSANLLAIAALTSPLLGDRRIKPGDEIITTALCFPTTVAPIVQCGAVPVFIDVYEGYPNANPYYLHKALTSKTKAVFLAHTLGMPFELRGIKDFCKKNNLWLIEDNCFVANTLIPTKNGTKHIYEIKKGDKLLGYNGFSFQETEVEYCESRLVDKEDILVIKFENGTTVRCTKDHPFYINNSWKKAKDIIIGDEVYHSTTSEFLSWRRTHILSKEAKIRMSNNMKKNNPSFNPEVVKKSATNRKNKITHIEKRVIKVIQDFNLPITYVGDKSFWIGSKKEGYKNPDFIFKEKKIVFEVFAPDFKYTLGFRKKNWKKERYNFFKKFGYHTEFISLKGWVNRKEQEKLAQHLRKIVSNGVKVISIKKLRNVKSVNLKEEEKDKVRVYNLKCFPYNNFCLTGGILVHNCDALGSQYVNEKGLWAYTGTFGDISTTSFYPPHMITTGQGGAVFTDDPLLSKIIVSMKDWGRDCECPSGHDGICGKRYTQEYKNLPQGFDHKYVYSHLGYNCAATDLQASIGVAQLKKLPEFIKKRKENFIYLKNNLTIFLGDKLLIPTMTEHSDPCWFGLTIKVISDDPLTRSNLAKHLENSGIQTRMLFAGNIICQPCFDHLEKGKDYRVIEDMYGREELLYTNDWMNNSLFIGVYPGLNETDLDYMIEKIFEFYK